MATIAATITDQNGLNYCKDGFQIDTTIPDTEEVADVSWSQSKAVGANAMASGRLACADLSFLVRMGSSYVHYVNSMAHNAQVECKFDIYEVSSKTGDSVLTQTIHLTDARITSVSLDVGGGFGDTASEHPSVHISIRAAAFRIVNHVTSIEAAYDEKDKGLNVS